MMKRPLLPRPFPAVLMLAIIAATAGPSAAAQGLEPLLRDPISPGSVALLVWHGADERVRERWAQALAHSRPEVRAAAGRAIHVAAERGLVPELVAALSRETDRSAAREAMRALANLGDEDAFGVLIDAAARLRVAAVAAEALATSRGVQSLDSLPALRAAGLGGANLARFLRRAVRSHPVSLVPLASRTLGERDVELWRAILTASRELGAELSSGILAAGASSEEPEIRAATSRHLLGEEGEEPAGATNEEKEAADYPTETVRDLPKKLVSGVFEAAGCKPTRMKSLPAALVTFAHDGRARKVSLYSEIEPEPCQQAVSTLFLLTLASSPVPVGGERIERRILLPAQEFLACLDEGEEESKESFTVGTDSIEPPKLRRQVTPVYPTEAVQEAAEGRVVTEVVIGRSGCVRAIRLVRGAHPRLAGAAFAAVARWRFEPGKLGGEPVPVIAEIEVKFDVRPEGAPPARR